MIYEKLEDLIGSTPLVRLSNIEKHEQLNTELYVKLEYLNPSGSIKDRTALSMIKTAVQSGHLQPGGNIIEPTSGNTGIGLAAISASMGYKAILVMPDSMSVERQKMLKIYGAQIVLTHGALGMSGAIDKANELASTLPNSIVLGQFDNPANVSAHYSTTGPEIFDDLNSIEAFVCGVGTGGTFTGTAKYLKEKNPNIKAFAVEPATSAVLSGKEPGKHGLQGIGAGFVPSIMDTELIDEIVLVTDNEAIEFSKLLASTEGFSVGITSGAAGFAAVKLAKKYGFKNIVAILPDSGDRYLSTKLFD